MWMFDLQLMARLNDKITRLPPQSEGNEGEEKNGLLDLVVWHFVDAHAGTRMELVWGPN